MSSARHIRMGLLTAICLATGARAQTALTWQQVRQVPSRQSDAGGGSDRYSGIQGPGDHGLSASESEFHGHPRPGRPLHRKPLPPVWARSAPGGLRLSPRAAAQAGTAPGERAQGDRHRGVAAGGPRAESAIQPAQRVCADAAGQGPAGAAPGKTWTISTARLAINRDRLRAGDIAQVDFNRLRVAAGAVRIGFPDRAGESAHRQDHPADAAERPHSGRPVRRDRAVRVLRPDHAARWSSTPSPWKRGRT